jgi:hypothetical protein
VLKSGGSRWPAGNQIGIREVVKWAPAADRHAILNSAHGHAKCVPTLSQDFWITTRPENYYKQLFVAKHLDLRPIGIVTASESLLGLWMPAVLTSPDVMSLPQIPRLNLRASGDWCETLGATASIIYAP